MKGTEQREHRQRPGKWHFQLEEALTNNPFQFTYKFSVLHLTKDTLTSQVRMFIFNIRKIKSIFKISSFLSQVKKLNAIRGISP